MTAVNLVSIRESHDTRTDEAYVAVVHVNATDVALIAGWLDLEVLKMSRNRSTIRLELRVERTTCAIVTMFVLPPGEHEVYGGQTTMITLCTVGKNTYDHPPVLPLQTSIHIFLHNGVTVSHCQRFP